MWEAEIGRIEVQISLGKTRSYLQNNQKKMV
jgi:hypothetical protein